jgi:pimeloyl-ACP methyl ester carboxylesterase
MRFNTTTIEGLDIFYREAGDPRAPKLVLLHGYPAWSHQYRNLIPALAKRFHVVAPDYPGFGNSAAPDPREFAYTFDHLADITDALLAKVGFTRFGLYVQDYGGPVGFRIMTRRPDAVEWLIVQNSNAYEVGFTPAWEALKADWKERTPEAERSLEAFLQPETIKQIHLHGHRQPELISPDSWNMDVHLLERPHARRLHLDLFYDYRTNVKLYPQCAGDSRRPSSCGARTTSSSRARAERPTSRTCPRPSSIASSQGTSPPRTAPRPSPRR